MNKREELLTKIKGIGPLHLPTLNKQYEKIEELLDKLIEEEYERGYGRCYDDWNLGDRNYET